MSTTWAGTASNQLVTRQALQNAIDTGAVAWRYDSIFIPNTDITKTITDSEARQYSSIPYQIPNNAANKVIPKSLYEGMAYTMTIGGRRDGANLTLYVSYTAGGAYTDYLTSSVCTIFGNTSPGSSSVGTMFLTTGGLGDPRVKFYLTEGGISCPISGTKYNDYVIAGPLTRNYNILITPVWDGTAYEMV